MKCVLGHEPIFAIREVMVPKSSRPLTEMMVESCICMD